MSPADIDVLKEQVHDMPIHVTPHELPYDISGYQANIALMGLERARLYGSPEARHFHESKRRMLAKLLGQE
jgi:hypothetical protein